MNNRTLETQVALHQQSIEALTTSTAQLVEATKGNGEKLDTLMISMAKQESILQKIASLEYTMHDHNKVIHHRVDGIEESIRKYQGISEGEGCPALKILRKDVEQNIKDTDSIINTKNAIIAVVFTALGAGVLKLLNIGGS